MNKLFLAILFFIMNIHQTIAQSRTDHFLKEILESNKDTIFNQVMNDAQTYRLQIIYTSIDRNKNNEPNFKNYYFNYDPQLYFNPASTVKLPLAALALEKFNALNKNGVNKFTTIQYDSGYEKQTPFYKDESAPKELPSIAHLIKRAFLISENDPYNRLYQFVGQQEIHRSLHDKGYTGVRIPRQFMGFTFDQNRHSNPLRFLDENGKQIYAQPSLYNPDDLVFIDTIKLGNGYMDRNGTIINEPFNFTRHNNISIYDLQQVLQSLVVPSSVPKHQRFGITEDDRRFLLQYLSQYPYETPYPKYDHEKFYDSYAKFFFRDSTKQMPDGLRVFNKAGWAYGFLTDVSYVADFENNIEYMLSATVYVNKDGILNDGKYEYNEIGYPFLYQLGQWIYRYELERKRKVKADLSGLQINFEKRDPGDNRKPISDVDN